LYVRAVERACGPPWIQGICHLQRHVCMVACGNIRMCGVGKGREELYHELYCHVTRVTSQ